MKTLELSPACTFPFYDNIVLGWICAVLSPHKFRGRYKSIVIVHAQYARSNFTIAALHAEK